LSVLTLGIRLPSLDQAAGDIEQVETTADGLIERQVALFLQRQRR
jgi:hypothetical protein